MNEKQLEKELKDESGYFVPGFSLVGLGIDLYLGTVPSGLLIGLGLGFLSIIIYKGIMKKKKGKKK